MRKIFMAASGLALLSATPAFAFTTYGGSSTVSAASSFTDPDAQFDGLAGSGDDGAGSLMEFGGSRLEASAAEHKLEGHIANPQEPKDPLSFSGFYFPPD